MTSSKNKKTPILFDRDAPINLNNISSLTLRKRLEITADLLIKREIFPSSWNVVKAEITDNNSTEFPAEIIRDEGPNPKVPNTPSNGTPGEAIWLIGQGVRCWKRLAPIDGYETPRQHCSRIISNFRSNAQNNPSDELVYDRKKRESNGNGNGNGNPSPIRGGR